MNKFKEVSNNFSLEFRCGSNNNRCSKDNHIATMVNSCEKPKIMASTESISFCGDKIIGDTDDISILLKIFEHGFCHNYKNFITPISVMKSYFQFHIRFSFEVAKNFIILSIEPEILLQ